MGQEVPAREGTTKRDASRFPPARERRKGTRRGSRLRGNDERGRVELPDFAGTTKRGRVEVPARGGRTKRGRVEVPACGGRTKRGRVEVPAFAGTTKGDASRFPPLRERRKGTRRGSRLRGKDEKGTRRGSRLRGNDEKGTKPVPRPADIQGRNPQMEATTITTRHRMMKPIHTPQPSPSSPVFLDSPLSSDRFGGP